MDILSRKKLTFRRDSSSAFFFLISLVFLFSLYSLFFSTLLLSSSHFTLLLSLYNKLFSDISVFPLYFHLLYFSLSFFFLFIIPSFLFITPLLSLFLSYRYHLSSIYLSHSVTLYLFFFLFQFFLFSLFFHSLSLPTHFLSSLLFHPSQYCIIYIKFTFVNFSLCSQYATH